MGKIQVLKSAIVTNSIKIKMTENGLVHAMCSNGPYPKLVLENPSANLSKGSLLQRMEP
jgi:hypothetical protein